MDREWLFISERIDDVSRLCGREHPIYEQVSNYSLALYVLGFLKCPDILSVEDMDEVEAGVILKEFFVPVKKENIPSNYNILKSKDKYLLVIGDPVFPTHFAVLTDMHRLQPLFSKLKIYGTGFDSLTDLENEFVGWEGVGQDDFIFYKMKQPKAVASGLSSNINTIKENGNHFVWNYELTPHQKDELAEVPGK